MRPETEISFSQFRIKLLEARLDHRTSQRKLEVAHPDFEQFSVGEPVELPGVDNSTFLLWHLTNDLLPGEMSTNFLDRVSKHATYEPTLVRGRADFYFLSSLYHNLLLK